MDAKIKHDPMQALVDIFQHPIARLNLKAALEALEWVGYGYEFEEPYLSWYHRVGHSLRPKAIH